MISLWPCVGGGSFSPSPVPAAPVSFLLRKCTFILFEITLSRGRWKFLCKEKQVLHYWGTFHGSLTAHSACMNVVWPYAMRMERQPPQMTAHWRQTLDSAMGPAIGAGNSLKSRSKSIGILWERNVNLWIYLCEWAHKALKIGSYCLCGNMGNNKIHNAGAFFRNPGKVKRVLRTNPLQEGKNERELNVHLEAQLNLYGADYSFFLCIGIFIYNVGILMISTSWGCED